MIIQAKDPSVMKAFDRIRNVSRDRDDVIIKKKRLIYISDVIKSPLESDDVYTATVVVVNKSFFEDDRTSGLNADITAIKSTYVFNCIIEGREINEHTFAGAICHLLYGINSGYNEWIDNPMVKNSYNSLGIGLLDCSHFNSDRRFIMNFSISNFWQDNPQGDKIIVPTPTDYIIGDGDEPRCSIEKTRYFGEELIDNDTEILLLKDTSHNYVERFDENNKLIPSVSPLNHNNDLLEISILMDDIPIDLLEVSVASMLDNYTITYDTTAGFNINKARLPFKSFNSNKIKFDLNAIKSEIERVTKKIEEVYGRIRLIYTWTDLGTTMTLILHDDTSFNKYFRKQDLLGILKDKLVYMGTDELDATMGDYKILKGEY